MLYALCGVSSVGKTTLLRAILHRRVDLGRLVTYTTRSLRPDEIDHVDYHFVSVPHFHAAVAAGQIVCPIQYRQQWYGTSYDDLCACAERETIAILRPDKLEELQRCTPTPLIGIAIVRPDPKQPVSNDDQIILEAQSRCAYQVTNRCGELDDAVTQILSILQMHAGG